MIGLVLSVIIITSGIIAVLINLSLGHTFRQEIDREIQEWIQYPSAVIDKSEQFSVSSAGLRGMAASLRESLEMFKV